MSIIRKKMKGGLEKLVLLGLVTDTNFIERILPIIDVKAFSTTASRTIAKWCLDYYDVYAKAPIYDIQIVYEQNIDKVINKADAEIIEELLENLSNDMSRRGNDISSEFALQQAVLYFQKRSMEVNVEELQELLDSGNIEEAKELLEGIELPKLEENVKNLNILTDASTLRKGFEDSSEPLIYFPNALGKFINPLLKRKGFVAILAPEKRNKTWLIDEIAIQGLRAKKNVAFFNLGDLDNEEQAVRFAIRLARKSNNPEYCGTFYSPVLDCRMNQDNTCTRSYRTSGCGTGGLEIESPEDVELAPPDYVPCRKCCGEKHFKGTAWYKKITIPEPLDWREALEVNEKFIKRYGITEDNLRMESYPCNTMSVDGIEKTLERWALEDGWEADIILIDYLDIAAVESKLVGTRHAENPKWQRTRGISQRFNALVVSPTQTDGAAYSQESLNEGNYSEDKRKYAHVTGVITLNQTEEEAELGIMRIGRFMTRNAKRTKAQVTVLQNIQRGLVHLGSYMSYPKQIKE